MLRSMVLVWVLGMGSWGFCDELEGLRKTHDSIGDAAQQLSNAIDNILGTDRHPQATETELTPKIILNGLKQLAQDPALDPKDSYESLKNQEARVTKAEQKKQIQDKIQDQIKTVMGKMGFSPVSKGSSTYQRDQDKYQVLFSRGEIIVSPIRPLPPVEP